MKMQVDEKTSSLFKKKIFMKSNISHLQIFKNAIQSTTINRKYKILRHERLDLIKTWEQNQLFKFRTKTSSDICATVVEIYPSNPYTSDCWKIMSTT